MDFCNALIDLIQNIFIIMSSCCRGSILLAAVGASYWDCSLQVAHRFGIECFKSQVRKKYVRWYGAYLKHRTWYYGIKASTPHVFSEKDRLTFAVSLNKINF